MYPEIIKIIEGGLNKDSQKVFNYSKKLANYFNKIGEKSVYKKITKLVEESFTRTAELDSLTTKPFDSDTHIDTVEVSIPKQSEEELFFDKFTENEINDFIKTYFKRDFLIKYGIDTNSNILLYGDPGTGKNSLARYISFQTKLPLITARLDGIVSSLLGNTSKNIRKVFEFASKQPCILFLDEFDVLAKVRDDKNELGELKRVVNSLIQNIDSLNSDSILIAATNHHDMLDSAIWRRFDTKIHLELPNYNVRNSLIKHFSSYIINNDFENNNNKIDRLIETSEGLSPSAIKTIFNQAAKKCLLNNEKKLKYSRLMLEVFIYKNNDRFKSEDAAKFMFENMVSQNDVSKLLSISLRNSRNIYKELKKNVK